jgi:hypothetical protein
MADKSTHGVDILIRPDEDAVKQWLERHLVRSVAALSTESGVTLSAKVVPVRDGLSALSIEVAR